MNTQILDPHHLYQKLSTIFQQASGGHVSAYVSILASVMVCGFIYAFFGYRVYRWVLILAGILAGVILAAHVTALLSIPVNNQSQVQMILSAILALVGGVAAPRLFHLFTFLLGGGAISLAIAPLVQFVTPPYGWVVLIICFAAGGFMAFLLMRPTLIIATSIAGSYVLSASIFSSAVHFRILEPQFNFLIFHGVWFLLGIFAISSQFHQKTPSHLDRLH